MIGVSAPWSSHDLASASGDAGDPLNESLDQRLQRAREDLESARARAHHAEQEARKGRETVRKLNGATRLIARLRPGSLSDTERERDDCPEGAGLLDPPLFAGIRQRATGSAELEISGPTPSTSSGANLSQMSRRRTIGGLGDAHMAALSARPFSGRASSPPASPSGKIPANNSASSTFRFNQILDENSTDENLFDVFREEALAAANGHSSCIFAYGPSGSGKSHNIRLLTTSTTNFLRHRVKDATDEGVEFLATLRICDVYDDRVTVLHQSQLLLDAAADSSCDSTWEVILDSRIRFRMATSNLVVLITVVRRESCGCFPEVVGRLAFVDLVASDRLRREDWASADRFKEARLAGSSLSSVADVLAARSRRCTHVPYRSSRLTAYLQESLFSLHEHTQTVLLVSLKTGVLDLAEAARALQFVQRLPRKDAIPAGPTGRVSRFHFDCAWRPGVEFVREEDGQDNDTIDGESDRGENNEQLEDAGILRSELDWLRQATELTNAETIEVERRLKETEQRMADAESRSAALHQNGGKEILQTGLSEFSKRLDKVERLASRSVDVQRRCGVTPPFPAFAFSAKGKGGRNSNPGAEETPLFKTLWRDGVAVTTNLGRKGSGRLRHGTVTGGSTSTLGASSSVGSTNTQKRVWQPAGQANVAMKSSKGNRKGNASTLVRPQALQGSSRTSKSVGLSTDGRESKASSSIRRPLANNMPRGRGSRGNQNSRTAPGSASSPALGAAVLATNFTANERPVRAEARSMSPQAPDSSIVPAAAVRDTSSPQYRRRVRRPQQQPRQQHQPMQKAPLKRAGSREQQPSIPPTDTVPALPSRKSPQHDSSVTQNAGKTSAQKAKDAVVARTCRPKFIPTPLRAGAFSDCADIKVPRLCRQALAGLNVATASQPKQEDLQGNYAECLINTSRVIAGHCVPACVDVARQVNHTADVMDVFTESKAVLDGAQTPSCLSSSSFASMSTPESPLQATSLQRCTGATMTKLRPGGVRPEALRLDLTSVFEQRLASQLAASVSSAAWPPPNSARGGYSPGTPRGRTPVRWWESHAVAAAPPKAVSTEFATTGCKLEPILTDNKSGSMLAEAGQRPTSLECLASSQHRSAPSAIDEYTKPKWHRSSPRLGLAARSWSPTGYKIEVLTKRTAQDLSVNMSVFSKICSGNADHPRHDQQDADDNGLDNDGNDKHSTSPGSPALLLCPQSPRFGDLGAESSRFFHENCSLSDVSESSGEEEIRARLRSTLSLVEEPAAVPDPVVVPT